MLDPKFGTIPFLDGTSLDAIELKGAIRPKKNVKFYGLSKKRSKKYVSFVLYYLFYRICSTLGLG